MEELGSGGTRKTGREKKIHGEEQCIIELEDSDVPAEMDANLPLTSFPEFRESSAQTTEADVRLANQEAEFEIDEFDGEIGDEWDWGDKSEKMWGEVALAPGATTEKRDEWVVIGSWGEDERL
ncbi:hypothetical protein EYC80_002322 [Monilinia laxa]|uniref:Uncharacterized protein n=1 Tax=Monilinia laxa TaxID=61186 RepID=A0A5N6K3M8_MONLA|nr:hypothetical protein EYC80_002322 [Monilinia laxa]